MTQETLQVTPENNPQTQEYVDAMAAKGEAAVNGGVAPEVISPKPEGIPDKFYNAETGVVDYAGMAKSYAELEKKISTPPAKDPAKETPDPKQEDADPANKAVADAGLDMAALNQEFAEKGSLSKESYDALAKAGITQETVDAYIEGRQAIVSAARTQAHGITEGETGYKAMVAWAVANASPEEIKAYNTAVNSKDSATRELAVKGLWTRYNAESGNASGNLIQGNGGNNPETGGYKSRQEMMVDMGDPRYKNDPAFRNKVIEKLSKSDVF